MSNIWLHDIFRPIHFQPMQFQLLPFQLLTILSYCFFNCRNFDLNQNWLLILLVI